MWSFEFVAERPGSRPGLPLAAVERLARPVSVRHARRRLLATTSALALVGTAAFFGIAAPRPAAACTIDVTGASGAVSNAGNIDCINIHGATVTGNVSNTGTLGSGAIGIAISGSTINGQVTDTGTILGGIRADGGSTITSTATGITVGPTSKFSGGIVNNGTITGVNGVELNTVSTFAGGISNSGTIAAQLLGTAVVDSGIVTGGIANSGTISSAHGFGIFLEADSVFSGGISNSGTISGHTTAVYLHLVSTFSGGITNSGVVSGPLGIVVSGGFSVATTLFSGGISNSGTISAAHIGILVSGVAQFGDSLGGGITNSGTIRVGANGTGAIVVGFISNFSGGISNSGTITGGQSAVGINTSTILTFSGGITNSGTIKVGAAGAGIVVDTGSFFGNVSNSGTITGAQTGIVVCNCATFENGAIVNSGVINANTNAIDAVLATNAVTIDQMAGTMTGNIVLPAGAGVVGTVNVFGGTINGNIVGTAGANDTINFNLGSGTFTYAAAFSNINQVNINSGTVVLNGANSATAVDVNGGTLAGTGSIDPTTVTIHAGGTLEPGTPGIAGGTLTVTGNLIFENGSFYAIAISPTQHSLGAVTGDVTINGGTVLLSPTTLGAAHSAAQFTILTATGTRSGTFNPTVGYSGSLMLSRTPTLIYDPQDVQLSYTNSVVILVTPSGANTNQQNVISGINTAILGGATVPGGFQTLGNFSGVTYLNALAQLSGEPATGAQKSATQLMTDFLNLMLDPTAGGGSNISGGGVTQFAPEQDTSLPSDVALAYAKALKAPQPQTPQNSLPQNFDQRWTAWGSAFGGRSWTKGDPAVGSNNVNASDYGFAAGMDYQATPNLIYGFGLSGGGTNWNLAQGLGSGRSDAFSAGVYAKSHWGPAYVSAALAFANHWFTTDRIALGDQLRASFTGQSYAARLEGGYRYAVPITGAIVGVTPYAALQAQDFHTPSYSETDLSGGGFGLSFASMNATDTRSELGARFDNLQVVNGMPLVLRGRLAWAHDWVSNPALGAVFEALPGSNFTVNGAAPPKNSALTTAAAELHITSNWTAIAKFDGDFGPGAQTYGGTGTLRYSW
jgi:uncharacterized protein with beta-barrel porin domain